MAGHIECMPGQDWFAVPQSQASVYVPCHHLKVFHPYQPGDKSFILYQVPQVIELVVTQPPSTSQKSGKLGLDGPPEDGLSQWRTHPW